MTGDELRSIRESLDMNRREFAAELGYQGNEKNNANRVEKYETGAELIPPYIARLAWLIQVHAHAYGGDLPLWPAWPAYLDGVPTNHKRRKVA